MKDFSIENPTVGELIKVLSEFPSETEVFMRDADTDWTISNFHFEVQADGIVMFGVYSEMDAPR